MLLTVYKKMMFCGQCHSNKSANSTDLGILLRSNLTYEYNIQKNVCEAFQKLECIFRSCKFVKNVDSLKSLYCSLVRGRLEWISTEWSPIYSKYTDAIERGINNNLLLEGFKYERREMQCGIF